MALLTLKALLSHSCSEALVSSPLCLLLFSDGLFRLPREYAPDRDGFDLFPNAFLFEEGVEG